MLAFLWNALLCSTIPTYLQCHIDVGVHFWWSPADLVDFLKFLHQTAVSRQLHDLHSASENTHTILRESGTADCHMYRKHKNLNCTGQTQITFTAYVSNRFQKSDTHILFLHHLWEVIKISPTNWWVLPLLGVSPHNVSHCDYLAVDMERENTVWTFYVWHVMPGGMR